MNHSAEDPPLVLLLQEMDPAYKYTARQAAMLLENRGRGIHSVQKISHCLASEVEDHGEARRLTRARLSWGRHHLFAYWVI